MLQKDDDENYSDDNEMNPGFYIGATVDIPCKGFSSFESGLLFTTKGAKFEYEYGGGDIKGKVNLYYLDIPLTLKASADLGEGFRVFGLVGPYVGIGLFGKTKETSEYRGVKKTEVQDVKWGVEQGSDLMRLDLGLTVGGGFEINSITVGATYDLGLTNNSASLGNGATIKNRVLKIISWI